MLLLPRSPLAPDRAPVPIAYRELGAGRPLLILHGGWGAGFYGFGAVPGHRVLVPDRTGYGASTRVAEFARPFHASAAAEAALVLDALGIGACTLWGHSDGAVIAAWMAILEPARYPQLILEAVHVDRAKPSSRAFFAMMAEDPDGFGPRVAEKLAAEHGEAWRDVIRADGRVWLELSQTPGDVYDGRLGEVRARTLVIQGADDPRSEPDELARLRVSIPAAEIHVLAGAAHSPHSERTSATTCTDLVTAFVRSSP